MGIVHAIDKRHRMPAYRPKDVDLLLPREILENGDVDAAVALYEPDAVFVVSPNHAVAGRAAIRDGAQQWKLLNCEFQLLGLQPSFS